MKKKIFLFLIIIFSFFIFLTSCDNKKVTVIVEEDKITQLYKPSITLDDKTVTWNKVENAEKYVINVNNKDIKEQTYNSYELEPDDLGEYIIKIKAISSSSLYEDSDYSNSVTINIDAIKLTTPVLTVDGDTITWNKVENAEKYILNINGNDLDAQTTNNYNLSDCGDYDIKVKAITTNKFYLNSDYSEIISTRFYDGIIESPVISETNDNTIAWQKPNNGKYIEKYIININNEDKEEITDLNNLSYNYSNLRTGTYNIKIKAISKLKNIGDSDYSNILSISTVWEEKLDAPKIILNSSILTWNEVENATSYDVYLDGENVKNTTSCSYKLTDTSGNHSLKIKALSNNDKYYASPFSNEVTYKTSKTGYLDENTGDFIDYIGTDAYVQVTNPTELFNAIQDAKYDYTTTVGEVITVNDLVERKNVRKNESNWKNALNKGLYIKEDDGKFKKIPVDTPFSDTSYTADMIYYEDSNDNLVSYTQKLNKAGTVHVIEIMNDLDLGWKKLSSTEQTFSFVKNFSDGKETNESAYTMSSLYTECGMTQINISNCYKLLIYSKNGSTIKHAGFKVESSNNVCFRNLKFDELWQWEDTSSTSTGKVGDMDAFGWAYFKINFSDEIWIDHCSFGKAYDGIIDVANPTYNTLGTAALRAPYNADNSCDVHISWCEFNPILTSGDIKDNYIYKMMESIEADYKSNGNHYLYYKALRDAGYSFEEILYGIAIPQKKAFLDGDSGNGIFLNTNLNISIAYCKFIDIEDRLPKLRGGNAYVYGTIIDCSRYIQYRDLLKSKTVNGNTISAKNIVSAINSTWKCAGVSHALMASMEGSLYAYGCIFKGIETLMCNNEEDGSKGSIIIENSRYIYKNINYKGSNLENNNEFSSSGTLSTNYFLWRTENNSIPFFVDEIDVDHLVDLDAHISIVEASNPTLVENYYLKSAAHR